MFFHRPLNLFALFLCSLFIFYASDFDFFWIYAAAFYAFTFPVFFMISSEILCVVSSLAGTVAESRDGCRSSLPADTPPPFPPTTSPRQLSKIFYNVFRATRYKTTSLPAALNQARRIDTLFEIVLLCIV